MDTIYDRRTPAAGVVVLPVPRPKVHGLTESAQGHESPDWSHSVMRPLPKVIPQTIGIMSTARSADTALRMGDGALCPNGYNSVLPTRGKGVRPGTRRRTPKMGPANPVFSARMPTQSEYLRLDLEIRVCELARLLKAIDKRGGDKKLEDLYETKRAKLVRIHGRDGAVRVAGLEG